MIKRRVKQLTALITASLATDASHAINLDADHSASVRDNTISVTPLNTTVSQYLAAHRSHSSHSSHSSHYSHRSSSSGGYSYSQPSSPSTYETPKSSTVSPQKKSQATAPSVQKPVGDKKELGKVLKDPEKRKNIIMRMQLALKFENQYQGPVNGIMDDSTRKAVIAYKRSKGIAGNTVLDVQTLNAFGIVGF